MFEGFSRTSAHMSWQVSVHLHCHKLSCWALLTFNPPPALTASVHRFLALRAFGSLLWFPEMSCGWFGFLFLLQPCWILSFLKLETSCSVFPPVPQQFVFLWGMGDDVQLEIFTKLWQSTARILKSDFCFSGCSGREKAVHFTSLFNQSKQF